MNKKLFELSYTLRKEKQQKNTFLIVSFIIILIIINITLKFIIKPVHQVSDSMNPDIQKNSFLFVNLMNKTPDIGDVVLLNPKSKKEMNFFKVLGSRFISFFTLQQVNLTHDEEFPGTYMNLRRVVGRPGDTIYMKNGIVYVKPANEKHFFSEFELTDRTYNLKIKNPDSGFDEAIGISNFMDNITLGNDEYFVLCDNRYSAFDSRIWGPVKSNEIKGKALVQYFPFKQIKLF